jgi:hypothetical protein
MDRLQQAIRWISEPGLAVTSGTEIPDKIALSRNDELAAGEHWF